MIDRILIACDGSEPSLAAARFGLSLAAQLKARVTLLMALALPTVAPVGPLSGYLTLGIAPTSEDLDRAKAILAALAQEFPAVAPTCRVDVGDPSETILSVSVELKASLIVLGARGLGPARRFLLGSVSDRVAHHAHCPVTIWR